MKICFRLIRMAKKYWGVLVVTVVSLIVTAGLNLLTPIIVRELMARISAETLTKDALVLLTGLLLGSYLLRWASRFGALYLAHVAAWNFVGDLIAVVYAKIQSLSSRYFSDRQTGDIMSRSINDTRQMEVLFAHALPDLLSNVCVVAGVTALIFWINPFLALLTILPVPIVIALSRVFAKNVSPLFHKNSEMLGELNSMLQNNISGVREIQAFGREKKENARMREFSALYAKTNIKANFAAGWFHPSVELATSLGTVIVVGLGGWLCLGDKLSAADMVGFFMCLGLFYQPLTTLARLVEDINVSIASAKRMLQIIDEPEEIADRPGAKPLARVEGRIEFSHVSFAYEEGVPVLDDVSFTANPGQMIALVGATGVGKSTAISLLERFIEPTKGKILLDGEDIQKVTLESLRENLSLVLQDVFLFSGTVADNIGFGTASPDEIRRAAKIAHADEFISRLPDGYDTDIGERGVKLSGGQKQRLAIARAVLRDAPVLLLDEATSAVDTETESRITGAIGELAGEKTIIAIAHRLSTIQRADLILVLEKGKIAESGKHEELMARNGIYAAMYSGIKM